MQGDPQDFQSRLASGLPARWFASPSPVLDGLQAGSAWAYSSAYNNLTYVAAQTRIKTATGISLDIISTDFFGSNLPRLTNEGDGPFRSSILANLFIKGPTRGNLSAVLQLLTGKAPAIFEPGNTSDSGAWDAQFYWDAGVASGGGWGDPLPYQAFLTVYRPDISLVSLAEWDAWRFAWDAYGAWSDATPNAITDAALIAAVESTRALGITVWMRIASSPISP